MRCRSALALLAAALALAATATHASPDSVKKDIAARLQTQLPGVASADYAMGAAAFDPDLRARVEENSAATAAIVEAGQKLWNRKFKDGRTLAACFPNGGRRIAANYPQFDTRLKRVVTLEMATELRSLNPRLRIEQVKDAGHALPFEQPERLREVVVSFLRELH